MKTIFARLTQIFLFISFQDMEGLSSRRGLQLRGPQQPSFDASRSYCPQSPIFPHFPPPPEYPPPERAATRFAPRYAMDDTDCIEICIEHDPVCNQTGKPKAKPRTKVNYAKNAHTLGHSATERSWNRSNIAVTMERYEPAAATASHHSPVSSPHMSPYHHPMQQQQQPQPQQHHSHQDYSYAYYEPGVAMRHAPPAPSDPGPSRPPPPNSIRALLNTASRKNSPNNRNNRYGTQENIYEEITNNDPRMRILSAGSSMVSLNQSMIEEEFRRIQCRHRRILGELNLSVEAMLMPETPPQNSPVREMHDVAAPDTLELLNSVGPTDELLSPVSTSAVNGCGDMDSGFSGSSSSASYVGSLRYHRPATASNTTAAPSCGSGGGNGGTQTRSSTPGGGNNSHSSYSGSIRSSQRSNEDHGGITSTTSRSFNSVYEKASIGSSKKSCDDCDSKTKPSFWSRKGWRKIPGFSSTTSVNKAGINGE